MFPPTRSHPVTAALKQKCTDRPSTQLEELLVGASLLSVKFLPLAVVMDTCDPSTREGEAGGS